MSKKKIFKNTIMNLYPAYVKKIIFNQLKETSDFNFNFKTPDEIFNLLLNYNKTLSAVEMYDYQKPFRHFCYFKYSNLDENKIKTLIEQGKIIIFNPKFEKPVDEFDIATSKPTFYQLENQIFFKFSYLLNDKISNKSIKYPVLAAFDKINNWLEIRFDRIGLAYKNSPTFYKEKIDGVLEYFSRNFELEITHIDFKAVVEYMISNKTDITFMAKKMLRNGTMAHLEAYEDEETSLPIIGELEKLIEDNKILFEKNSDTQKILNLLENFLTAIEIKSDLPVVKIKLNDTETKFGITHNYKGAEYSLFMLYGELIGGEMMDNVKNYVMQCCREFDTKISSDALPKK